MLDKVWPFAHDYVFPLLMGAVDMNSVPKEIADIQNELESFEAFINDADRKAEAEDDKTRDRIKTRVKLLRETAFRMEDVIDEYISCEEQQPSDPGCAVLPCEPADFIKTMILRLQIAFKIKTIKSQVCEIKERSERDGFPIQSSLEQAPESSRGNQDLALHNLRMLPFYIEEDDVVGFEAPKAALIGWLVKGRSKRTVISLVGMGGQGKTTLAKKVFDNNKVTGHFNCHSWVTVSQSYTVERLLRDMLQQLCKEKEVLLANISKVNRDSLTKEVRSYLQQKRYIVFFDDVWNEHFWDQIEFALIDNENGSRIFITTRDTRVASCCKKTSCVEVHEIQPLTHEKSFELFCRKAFGSDLNGCCPQSLMDKDPLEWESLSQNLSLELKRNSHIDAITKILALSYHDLPYYLKQCFLYFGIYPEDYEVKVKKLFRQWIAEGFVKQEGRTILEEIANKYLIELVSRSLVQVFSFTTDGKITSCRIHDLLRDMILRKSKDLSFCHFISEDGGSDLSGIIRRLSISSSAHSLLRSTESVRSIESSDVRSLFVFKGGDLPADFVRIIVTKHKPLKVLDFENAKVHFCSELDEELLLVEPEQLEIRKKQLKGDFIKSIGDFIHLKYLSLRGAILLPNLPKSIGKLKNMETLDLRNTNLHELPREISKLEKLRHLRLSGATSLIQLKDCIGLMTSLQTLNEVNDDGGGAKLIRELGKLMELRELHITGVRKEHGSTLCSSVNEMQYLEKLQIQGKDSIDLHFISSPPRKLRKLFIYGMLSKMPEWIPELQNLVKLSLTLSRLADDPMKSLKNVPNLLFLGLYFSSYEGESLHFQEGGFQKLKELYLKYLHKLNSIFIDKGALPSLKMFQLISIPELKTLPSGIQYLKKLEVLDIYGLPTDEFIQIIAADEGEEHSVIKHVPLLIRTTIKSRNKIVHLDGPAPANNDPKFAVWDNEDSFIMTWLWNSMTPEVGRHCMFLSSAKEIWDSVHSTYSLKQDMAARYELRNKIFSTK
ncbi:disease resistance protein RPM1-like [Gastrolobium bilobum]|uniref:disease resistance protein RPM1-like n=1 Tax=Gastrolobium bilobum TaxID=150636 RepID=UPI002AB0D2F4|nr:disease resistance protein RPM1-like [Gastrolobium bilobum]